MTSWTGTCASRGMAWLGVLVGLLLVALTVFLLGEDIPTWVLVMNTVLIVLIPLALIVAARVRVDVTSDAFVLRWGPAGWPKQTFRWTEVAAVSVVTIDPWEWGGWGYRWASGGRGWAAVVRRGPAIQLDLKDGRRFTATVDDAEAGCTAACDALAKAHPA